MPPELLLSPQERTFKMAMSAFPKFMSIVGGCEELHGTAVVPIPQESVGYAGSM